MKITPLEIRQKEFEKNFRGYDKDEVNAFLQTLSQEWERILDDNREMRLRLETTQREVEKLREVESSLFKTLKTAEDTGASIVDQASKTAELRVRESNIKAEEILSEARIRGKAIVEKAETKARQVMEEMHNRVKELRQNYKEAQEDYDRLVSKMKVLAMDTLKKLERTEEEDTYNIDVKVREAEHTIEKYYEEEAKRREEEEKEQEALRIEAEQQQRKEQEKEAEVVDEHKDGEHKPRKSRSFFDDIE